MYPVALLPYLDATIVAVRLCHAENMIVKKHVILYPLHVEYAKNLVWNLVQVDVRIRVYSHLVILAHVLLV